MPHAARKRGVNRIRVTYVLVLVLLAALSMLASAPFAGAVANAQSTDPAAITRTPWEMNLGGGTVDIREADQNTVSRNPGDPLLYDYMQMPPLDDPGWQRPSSETGAGAVRFVVDGDSVIFGGETASILGAGECATKADFTYFKTEVTIPAGATVTKFEVSFDQVDDGARAYIRNSRYPNGQYPQGAFDPTGDILFNSPAATTANLANFVVPGETNTVIIVQVDNCPPSNNLKNAQISFAGTVAGKEVRSEQIAVVGMGAGPIRYVDHDAVGRATGESWVDAFLTVGDALEVAQPGDQIWVAEGVYYPDQIGRPDDKTQVVDSNDIRISYRVPSGVKLYGGFAGTEADLAARNWEQHATVLSGDIEQDDELKDNNGVLTDASGIRGNNSQHVIYLDGSATPITDLTLIDGFRVTGGAAYDDSSAGQPADGGGLYCHSGGNGGQCSPLLEDLVFSGNHGGRSQAARSSTTAPTAVSAVPISNLSPSPATLPNTAAPCITTAPAGRAAL